MTSSQVKDLENKKGESCYKKEGRDRESKASTRNAAQDKINDQNAFKLPS